MQGQNVISGYLGVLLQRRMNSSSEKQPDVISEGLSRKNKTELSESKQWSWGFKDKTVFDFMQKQI